MKTKKSQLVGIIILISLLIVLIAIVIVRTGNLYDSVREMFGIEKKCEQTGLTLTEYQEKINAAKSQNNKQELDNLYAEAEKCFPEEIKKQ